MKKLLLTTALVALVSPALAAEKGPTVTLGGSLDTQAGYRQQKTNYRFDSLNSASVGANQLTKGGIVNDTRINVKVDGQAHGFKYGGLVSLNADTSKNKYGNSTVGYQTMVYGEAKFGRIEAGTYTGAADALSVSAASIAKATGGIAGDSRYWWNPNIITGPVVGATVPSSELVSNTFYVTPSLISNMDTGNTANAAKVSIFTPKYSGVKVGVSYIPDTEHSGTIADLSARTKVLAAAGNNQFAYRDVISGGIMLDHKMNDVTIKASLLGETGKAKDFSKAGQTAKRNNLRAWELGGSVTFKGFSVAASYGDLGKSGTVKSVVGSNAAYTTPRSNYWTAGAAYEYNHLGASVTYLQSKRGNSEQAGAANPKARFTNLSFGVDYRVAPGFMPYAEVSAFKLDTKIAGATKNTGNIFLAGTKLQF